LNIFRNSARLIRVFDFRADNGFITVNWTLWSWVPALSRPQFHSSADAERRSNMKGRSIVLAAALTVAGISLCPAFAGAGPTAAPSAAPMASVKSAPGDAPESQIQGTLQSLAQDALTQNDMSKLVSLLNDSQQQSFAKSSTYSQGYGDKLDAQITALNKTWKQKYGHEFSTTGVTNAFGPGFAAIRVQTPAKTSAPETATASLTTTKASATLDVPLIRDKQNQWKIDTPASLTIEKLRANLLAELTAVNSAAAHWPANETDAYRNVSRHVLMAVLDKPLPAAAQQASAITPKAAVKTVQPTAATAKPAVAATHHWWQFWD